MVIEEWIAIRLRNAVNQKKGIRKKIIGLEGSGKQKK